MIRFLTLVSVLILAGCLEKDSAVGIDTPYAFATAPGAKNGAAFLIIHNEGGEDTLIGAQADIAERTEIHDMAMENGVMRMRQLDALLIGAGESVELAPKGKHIMFMNLHEPLVEDTTFDLTLTFAKAGEMTFPVMITAPGQKPDAHAHDHDHDHHYEGDGHDHH